MNTKKILIVLWTVALLGVIAWFGLTKYNKSITRYVASSKVESNMFDYSEIKNLLSNNEHILLIVGIDSCELCNILMPKLSNYPMPKYYIAKNYCNKNSLVAQALRTSGFPTTYVLDKEYRIAGEIIGLRDFEQRLNDVMVSINNQNEKTNDMIIWSFKALLAYFAEDYESMYVNAINSLKYGNYFFNNYLLYLYEIQNGSNDTIKYKTAALNSLEDVDYYIYEELIHEIAPEVAELYTPPKHVHNESCNHHH